MIPLQTYWQEKSRAVEKALETLLPKESEYPPLIHQAMRYAVLGGGKRFRSALTLATNEMLGGKDEGALVPACATELIHCYSLVHDDLPLMDNAELRRGKPSCHKKYGEAVALLAGDALLTHAFQLLGTLTPSEKSSRLVLEISKAAGTGGMIGGQLLDILSFGRKNSRISKAAGTGGMIGGQLLDILSSEKKDLALKNLDDVNRRKTGALIQASCLMGSIVGGASNEEEKRILKFGECLGFAFQVVDDIIDGDGYLVFMSKEEARKKAAALIEEAKEALSPFEKAGERLCLMADLVFERAR